MKASADAAVTPAGVPTGTDSPIPFPSTLITSGDLAKTRGGGIVGGTAVLLSAA
ncbi:hypothetical protein JHN63_14535 [Streptomyces sp. MBT65]|uniref:hypothetical protein n=1 Tax=Streptomyces sp. MBT65 TaxID=1488395 RepID=UPI00190D5419|nr:hypothetical protein [Streptomyces sp. MBT65]MBK3575005.1 hypothetical protein [Streptomyces sp. MBT65]